MIVIRSGRPRGRSRRSIESDELFRALVFGGNAVSSSSRGIWRPPTEVYETETTLEVVAEIAGMDREEIEVLIEGDVISLHGTRPDPAICDKRSYHEARIAYGEFSADLHIPYSVDGDAATATYENGFLRISIPKISAKTIIARKQDPADTEETSS